MRTLIALLLVVGLTSVATAQDAAISGAAIEADLTSATTDRTPTNSRTSGAAIILDAQGNLVGQLPDGAPDDVIERLKQELVGAEEAGYDTVTDEYK